MYSIYDYFPFSAFLFQNVCPNYPLSLYAFDAELHGKTISNFLLVLGFFNVCEESTRKISVNGPEFGLWHEHNKS